MRQQGAIDEVRSILTEGIDEIVESDPSDFDGSSERVLSNIDKAFKEHEQRLADLTKKKLTFAGKDIGTFLVTGVVSVSSALLANPLLGGGIAWAASQIGSPSLPNLITKAKGLAEEDKKLRKSPVGMLFHYKNQN